MEITGFAETVRNAVSDSSNVVRKPFFTIWNAREARRRLHFKLSRTNFPNFLKFSF